eukprot:CFRG7595T1
MTNFDCGVVELSKQDFYGVYIITSLKVGCKYDTYVGFSVDPSRRLRQHNGDLTMGAKKTSRKQPWELVMVVHGFPDEKSALRFEWAWQHSKISRHIASDPKIKVLPKSTVTKLPSMLKVVDLMLNSIPWNRLPLTVQWINIKYMEDFLQHVQPPKHMRILFGPIVWQKSTTAGSVQDDEYEYTCMICLEDIELKSERWLGCGRAMCRMRAHMPCLADWFLKDDPTHLLPVTGSCPVCRTPLRWGDLVQKYGHEFRVETSKRRGKKKSAGQPCTEPQTPTRSAVKSGPTDACVHTTPSTALSSVLNELELSSPVLQQPEIVPEIEKTRRKTAGKCRHLTAVDLFPSLPNADSLEKTIDKRTSGQSSARASNGSVYIDSPVRTGIQTHTIPVASSLLPRTNTNAIIILDQSGCEEDNELPPYYTMSLKERLDAARHH